MVRHICTAEVKRLFYSFQIHVVMTVIRVTTADGHALSSDKPPLLIRTVDVAVFIICLTFEATIDFVCPVSRTS
jgi:steroid 5-alpha reductase family enzyme